MALKLKKIRLPDSRELSYIEAGNPLGIPLVFLHGLGDSCRSFELLFQHLPARLRAIAFTQRGHDGINPPEASYRTADFEADLLLFLDAAAISKAFIIGASSGGFAARNFAAAQKERTLGLILVGAPSALGDKPRIVDTYDSTLSRLTDPINPAFIRSFTENLVTRPVPTDFLEMIFSETQKVPARVWKETSEAALKEQFPGSLHTVEASALIISGGKDSIASPEDQKKLADGIADSHLVIFSQLGHMLYWEDPENIAQAITTFVDEVWEGLNSDKAE